MHPTSAAGSAPEQAIRPFTLFSTASGDSCAVRGVPAASRGALQHRGIAGHAVGRRETGGSLTLRGGTAMIAGPCSIETREQAFAVAEQVANAGAQFFRGGAYKPRTSPYAFQGLGEDALKIMAEIRDRFGMRIVTEAIDNEALELVDKYADVIQIGARNMQNYSLLKAAGRKRKPVLLKRGIAATLEEFLMAAEYIMSEGNYQVILCERGARRGAP